MCGRYSLIAELSQLALRFNFNLGELLAPPRYNVAPTQPALTVINPGRAGGEGVAENRAGFMRWGLIPSWSKSAPASPLINARAETLAERPSFRGALERRRCLALADGFYDWREGQRSGPPVYVSLASGQPFAMAGLWERWQPPAGDSLYTFTVVTTAANSLLAPIHHRMPVILAPDQEAAWLDPQLTDADLLGSMLTAYPEEELQLRPVSTLVNSVANDGPECLAPPESPVESRRLL